MAEEKIIKLRAEIRKGILDQTVGDAKKLAGTADAVEMFMMLFDQGFRCYNTEYGALLSMLSTLVHIVQSSTVPGDELKLVDVLGGSGRDTVANRALLVAGCTPDADTDYLQQVMDKWMQGKEIERTKQLTEEVAVLRARVKESEARVKELEASADKRADARFRELIEKYTSIKMAEKELAKQ